MATITRGPTDQYVEAVKAALEAFEREHPGAEATLYRQNTGSIRIRIVDERFAPQSRGDRHDSVWNFLCARLDDDTLGEISVLLPLSPKELRSSFMNAEFEAPIPSQP